MSKTIANSSTLSDFLKLSDREGSFVYHGYEWGYLDEENYKFFVGHRIADGDWRELRYEDDFHFAINIKCSIEQLYGVMFSCLQSYGVRFVGYILDFIINYSQENDDVKYYRWYFGFDCVQITAVHYGENSCDDREVIYLIKKERTDKRKTLFKTVRIDE